MNEIIITNTNGQPTTSSLGVAEIFGKQHKHIVEAIEELEKKAAEFSTDTLFIETVYQRSQNNQWYRRYEITKDGFALLSTEFTGKKALEWKLKYIEAFNTMERKLNDSNIDIENVITETFERTVQALMPYLMVNSIVRSRKQIVTENTKSYSRMPSKIESLPSEIRKQVDDMIESQKYSCQQIANFIMNNSDTEISKMSVNRYRKNHFTERNGEE